VTTMILFWALLLVFFHGNIIRKSFVCNLPFKEELNQGNSTFTAEDSTRMRRLPQAIIVGIRKGGTRALLKFLEVNPAIRAAQNEIHFFDRPENYKLGLEWYRRSMPPSEAHEITIEKSPSYFITEGVPEKLRAMNSSVKLILILRDPVTRLISDFTQLAANKLAPVREEGSSDYYEETNVSDSSPMNELSRAILDKAGRDFERYVLRPDGGIDDQRKAVKIGMYSVYLERWRSFFPLKQIHLVDGENLIVNPFEELNSLELFLGLEPKIKPEHFVFNPRKGFYCLTPGNARQEFLGERDWRNRSQVEIPARNCLSKSKGRKHVVVREELIEELRNFYAPYNEFLYSMTGKNLSWIRLK